VLEVEPIGSYSRGASVAAALVGLALVTTLIADLSAIFWLAPLALLVVSRLVRVIRNDPRPTVELRADGIVIRELFFGPELWVPWTAVAEIDTMPFAENVVTLELARLSQTSMDSSLSRVLESIILASLGKRHVTLAVPSDIPKERFVEMLERRVLDSARADVGLLGRVDQENTI